MGRDITEGTPDSRPIYKIDSDANEDPTGIVDNLGIGRKDQMVWDEEGFHEEADLIILEKGDMPKMQRALDENRFPERLEQLREKGFREGGFVPLHRMNQGGQVERLDGEFALAEDGDFKKEWESFWSDDANRFWRIVQVFLDYMSANPKDTYRFYCFR